MTNNPYSSPLSSPSVRNAEQTLPAIARKVFLDWEKLRIVYVLVLAFTTFFLIGPAVPPWQIITLIIEGAVIANVLYFAGPITETYIRWLGYDQTWLRWLMFGSGILLSIVLAVGLLATELLPNQS